MKQFDMGLKKLTMLRYHSFRKVVLMRCHKKYEQIFLGFSYCK